MSKLSSVRHNRSVSPLGLSSRAGVAHSLYASRPVGAGLPRSPASKRRLIAPGLVVLYLRLLCTVLLGYALLGKGFAYLGLPPLYVSEMVLGLGLLVAFLMPGAARVLFTLQRSLLPVYLMCIWGAMRTIPYLSEYGINAFRDAVLWGYALFAMLIVAFVKTYPRLLEWLLARYERFASLFPLLIVIAQVARRLPGISGATVPGTSIPLLAAKAGDTGVHLAGAATLYLVGPGTKRVKAAWFFLVVGAFLLVAVANRSGALSFVCAIGLALLLKARISRTMAARLLKFGLAAALILSVVLGVVVINPRALAGIGPLERTRAKYRSVLYAKDYTGTITDRLEWWAAILDYTILGEHFWTGKGFGINLAEDDGFTWSADPSAPPLRSPHNAHLNMLARAGVPGFLLWLLVQGGWALALYRAYRSARRHQMIRWERILLFLIGYWAAFMINASFDVFLEGPMGGIWFWVVYGFGMAAVGQYRRELRALRSAAHSTQPEASGL